MKLGSGSRRPLTVIQGDKDLWQANRGRGMIAMTRLGALEVTQVEEMHINITRRGTNTWTRLMQWWRERKEWMWKSFWRQSEYDFITGWMWGRGKQLRANFRFWVQVIRRIMMPLVDIQIRRKIYLPGMEMSFFYLGHTEFGS